MIEQYNLLKRQDKLSCAKQKNINCDKYQENRAPSIAGNHIKLLHLLY